MTNEVAKKEQSMSERFTAKVMAEFGHKSNGGLNATEYEKQLIQGYFIAIDRALQTAEEGRIRKNQNNKDPKYNNNVPVTWQNVDLQALAVDVMNNAKIGLDMMQDNTLFPIPYLNKKTGKYTVNLMKGYNGVIFLAEKYALEKPKAVTTELVYETDTFKPIKKDVANKVESYEFEINNPFNRGKIIGAFGYIEFDDAAKNKLIIMTLQDILKRRDAASGNPEFWGGKVKKWQNGRQVEVEDDMWFAEMALKTIKREVYKPKNIPLDPTKIDESYQALKRREAEFADMQVAAEIEENNCKHVIDVEATVSDYEEPQQLAPAEEVDETPLNTPEPEKEEEPEF